MLDKSNFLHLKRFRVEELKARLLALEAMKQGLEDNVRQLDDALERENLRSGDFDDRPPGDAQYPADDRIPAQEY